MFNLNFFMTMKLQVHSIHFDADRKLVDFIQRKIDKLETFYDRLVDGEVFLRLNNEGIENKTVEIKLNVPGTQLFAVEKARSFEAATDLATLAIRMQLKKFKTKIRNGRV
jgi:putative sigma-54 modulation protein